MPKRRFRSMAYMPEAEKEDRVLICIPAFNESATISAVLDSIIEVIPANFDILIVDDGSEDLTAKICRMKANVKTIEHIFNMGYGAALKTAYKYAADNGYDYIIQMDADGQHDVANIIPIYQRLCDDDMPDIVIGSRFLKGAESFATPFYKKIVINFFRMLIRMTCKVKITDPTSGLQGIRRSAFIHYARFNRFAIDYPDANMIIQMAMKGYKIVEIPAIMHVRNFGVSMHSGLVEPFMYIIKMMLSVFVVGLREMNRKPKVYYKEPKKKV
ncbi:MAG: glycosyltransferase family 2 protein [Lachnospiraceae bacterium]|nr:glycosyltransferase family 2 protein [Lachnospiraceae bacterium]